MISVQRQFVTRMVYRDFRIDLLKDLSQERLFLSACDKIDVAAPNDVTRWTDKNDIEDS